MLACVEESGDYVKLDPHANVLLIHGNGPGFTALKQLMDLTLLVFPRPNKPKS